ncbi:MAG: hypothetical protein KIS81_01125 [Maricaulaceae bacterium]|nr:hypothetical protein [Maricaulaceae bacterium]
MIKVVLFFLVFLWGHGVHHIELSLEQVFEPNLNNAPLPPFHVGKNELGFVEIFENIHPYQRPTNTNINLAGLYRLYEIPHVSVRVAVPICPRGREICPSQSGGLGFGGGYPTPRTPKWMASQKLVFYNAVRLFLILHASLEGGYSKNPQRWRLSEVLYFYVAKNLTGSYPVGCLLNCEICTNLRPPNSLRNLGHIESGASGGGGEGYGANQQPVLHQSQFGLALNRIGLISRSLRDAPLYVFFPAIFAPLLIVGAGGWVAASGLVWNKRKRIFGGCLLIAFGTLCLLVVIADGLGIG